IKERSALNSVAVLYSWFRKNRDLFVAGAPTWNLRTLAMDQLMCDWKQLLIWLSYARGIMRSAWIFK
ncbi:hypothetical protein, partial [Marinobacter nauticus]|uniref:hypothetical protein n=1 Tax=Marinobacter nauticus TaxID=2743 RepID=UPI004044A5A4